MDDLVALRRAVAASPEDMHLRLALADYLDAIGENSRARFIRIQIMQHFGEPVTYSDEKFIRDVCVREISIWQARELNPLLVGSFGGTLPIVRAGWRRGCIEEMQMSCFDFDVSGVSLLLDLPLTSVTIHLPESNWRAIAEWFPAFLSNHPCLCRGLLKKVIATGWTDGGVAIIRVILDSFVGSVPEVPIVRNV